MIGKTDGQVGSASAEKKEQSSKTCKFIDAGWTHMRFGNFHQSGRRGRASVAAMMPVISRGLFRVRKWIDEALGGAARCRCVTLR